MISLRSQTVKTNKYLTDKQVHSSLTEFCVTKLLLRMFWHAHTGQRGRYCTKSDEQNLQDRHSCLWLYWCLLSFKPLDSDKVVLLSRPIFISFYHSNQTLMLLRFGKQRVNVTSMCCTSCFAFRACR